ncbi:hypothetical protein [Thiocapsa sp. UBA6158]|jgi:hypothetical protein|uniref:hypothetical protein n=1 Tax=Thiocapsa sp. UBA6158 TaxID=1947692 RepID=UPI0025E63D19|nr:hypothetical protein [Thiocapsa sp. UBA6158]
MGIQVTSVADIAGVGSFEALASRIANTEDDEFVVVVHADPNGVGLLVPLVTNARAHSTGADLEILNQIAGRERSDPTPAELQKLGIYNNDVSRLIALRERLHSKKIRAIEFRGCNLGRSPRSVRAFCSFFGAVRLGAPQLHSFFGDPAVLHGPGVVDSHEAGHRGDRTYSYTYPSGSGRCVCCFGVDLATQRPVNGHIVADNLDSFNRWIQTHLDRNGTLGNARQLPIHGLWKLPGADNPDPAAIPTPIFPIETTDGLSQYAINMTYQGFCS